MKMKECSMKKIIFALLCVCLLAAASAVFADGETVRVQAGTAEFPLAPETTRVFEWTK